MTVNIDLFALYEQQFGQPLGRADQPPPNLDEVVGNVPGLRAEEGYLGSPYYKVDGTLGVEYYMPVTASYVNADGRNVDYDLPFPVVMITGRKMLVETPLVNRRGSVKELIQTGDFDIRIRGLIVNRDNEYPEVEVAQLRSLCEIGRVVSVRSVVTDIFLIRGDRKGSTNCVVRDFVLTGQKGVKHVVPYEVQLVSDEPFSLVLIK